MTNNLIASEVLSLRREARRSASTDRPAVLAILPLSQPLIVSGVELTSIELRDIEKGRRAAGRHALVGIDSFGQAVAALGAMSGISVDSLECLELGDLGRCLTVVAALMSEGT